MNFLQQALSFIFTAENWTGPAGLTARILEQIIQETTNRMNRLSQQESENEIKMFAMDGQIEQETKRAELLKVLQTH